MRHGLAIGFAVAAAAVMFAGCTTQRGSWPEPLSAELEDGRFATTAKAAAPAVPPATAPAETQKNK